MIISWLPRRLKPCIVFLIPLSASKRAENVSALWMSKFVRGKSRQCLKGLSIYSLVNICGIFALMRQRPPRKELPSKPYPLHVRYPAWMSGCWRILHGFMDSSWFYSRVEEVRSFLWPRLTPRKRRAKAIILMTQIKNARNVHSYFFSDKSLRLI